MIAKPLKSLVQRCVNTFGYRVERLIERVEAPIDVLDLLLTKLALEVPDFFFVQLGANDGITDDPIRKYITRYHWRGILVEPQPQVFETLRQNYQQEPQLIFENAAIAEHDGQVRFFVARVESGPNANLTVFSSLKKDAVLRGLRNTRVAGVQARIDEVEVQAVSVSTLLARHQVPKVDFLQTDLQGYDCEVVRQFLACGVKPIVIHFENCHTARPALQECYRALVKHGYRFVELDIDTVAYLTPN